MITGDIFDPKALEFDAQREQVAGAVARLIGSSRRVDRRRPLNGTVKMEHTSGWNDGTSVTTYAFRGQGDGSDDVPRLVAHVSTRSLTPPFEFRSRLLDVEFDDEPTGFRIEQSFDEDLVPTDTLLSPHLGRGVLFARRRAERLALPVVEKLLHEFAPGDGGENSIAALLR